MKNYTECATHVDLPPTKAKASFTSAGSFTHVDLPPIKAKASFTSAGSFTHVDLPPIKAKFAFTLAEVLITLGIIGIVAAMTIPALMANISDRKNSAMLKEDYSILKQMMLLANDAGAVGSFPKSDDMQQMKNWFETFVQPHIKTTEVCYNRWGCWNKDVKISNGSKYQGNTICGNGTVSFIMTNGSFVCMDDAGDGRFGVLTNGATTMVMLVDLNGDKQPNVIGKDIFAFALKDDQLLPGGYDMTEQQINQNCSLTGSGSYAGTYCTVKAARQNFKLPVLK